TATNLSNAATIAIGASPAISASSTPTCVGAPYGTGTITVTATGGTTPYTYTLNGGSSQPNNTFSGLSAGTYTVAITTNSGCTASTTATVISYPNSADDQNATGSDSWIGHLYSGMNFQNYKGNFTETEQFNEGFGGDYNCFNVTSGAGTASVYTEQFSVRFKMNSSKNGLYVVDLGSDDGSRLSVDGTMVYNNWVDQPFSTKPRVLINLTGTSSLQYDFYENLQNNQVIFQNLVLVLANTLNTNTSQNVCQGSTASAISGDVYATTLPTGVSKSGTGYQWTYSTSPGGARTNITGATSAAFTPNTSAAPFNVPGTYYVYRNASLVSSNNTGYASVTATNESNPATITISPLPLTPTVTPGGSTTFCTGGNVTLASSGGTTYLWSTGATTQSINTATSGSYTVKVTNASGCQSASSAATVVTVNALPAIPTITASGSTTFCAGGSVTLTSSTGTSYIWSTGATTASISPATAGSYTVKVTNESGCQSASSAATVVAVNALPANPTASVTAQPTCTTSTGTIMVTAPSGAGITYSIDGVTYTNTTGTFTNVNPGTYNVTAKNSNGCISPATVVTVNAQPVTPVAPTVSITQPNCTTSTGTITITAPTGAGITYSIDGINYLASVTFTAINAGTYSVTAKNSNGCTSSATSAIVNPQPATPAAPMVTSPVIYCQNATASPLTAAGSNLIWGSQPPVSSSIGGTGVLSSAYFIDATYNNRLTYFTTNSPNVTITSVDYYVGSWQQVNGMVLSLFNSSGQVIATSSTITTLTAGSSPVRITNAFNFTIPTAGNYSIGLSAGLGNIGANTPGFPQTESTGSMTLTGI
ncbi:MAG: beta strand repeat-containing protein, partial [Ginsengibacter sp.]